ncbi:MAG: 30S ribosomal protein S24e [Candidatus Bathyarchaeia archaeon]|nr:30S ribosomal protein S24e [Candidatus Bathyarchaeota archaeon]
MKVKIVSNKRNELLKRNEIIFSVSHENSPTPSRLEMRRELARILKTDAENVYVRRMESTTGLSAAIGEAHVYDSPSQANHVEPKYIMRRNSPKTEG